MVKKYYIKYLPFKSNIFFQNSSLHAGDSDSDDDDDDMDDEDDDLFEDAEEGDDDAFNTEKEEAARSLLSLQNPTNSMTNQGLLPNRPKSSAYLGDLQSAPINQSTDQPSSSEDPLLRSEQALVSANTQRAQDLQQVQGESRTLSQLKAIPAAQHSREILFFVARQIRERAGIAHRHYNLTFQLHHHYVLIANNLEHCSNVCHHNYILILSTARISSTRPRRISFNLQNLEFCLFHTIPPSVVAK